MKPPNVMISHHTQQPHSFQFYSTKLNEFSQNFNATTCPPHRYTTGINTKIRRLREWSGRHHMKKKVHNKTLRSAVQTNSQHMSQLKLRANQTAYKTADLNKRIVPLQHTVRACCSILINSHTDAKLTITDQKTSPSHRAVKACS